MSGHGLVLKDLYSSMSTKAVHQVWTEYPLPLRKPGRQDVRPIV